VQAAVRLIQVKAAIKARRHASSITGDSAMPTDSLLVSVCVIAMFVVFGAVLYWGDLQTRSKGGADSSHGKRRAF
jgi:hypothetical protein